MKYDVEKLKEAIESSDSMQEACNKLGWHFNTFKKRSVKHGLYDPEKGWRQKSKPMPDRKNIEDIHSRRGVKHRILKENLLPYVCAVCNVSEWNGKPISLHLDHINGKNGDHRIENLRFLCPNCHSQTDTYTGKNK
jgi:5-methylcytosine-specific restriction endonuclease McrA